METPIFKYPSEIERDKLWACIKTALISLIWIPLTAAGTFILVDYKVMNKPVKVIERAAFYNEGGQRIYVTEDTSKWFISGDPITKLTPLTAKDMPESEKIFKEANDSFDRMIKKLTPIEKEK